MLAASDPEGRMKVTNLTFNAIMELGSIEHQSSSCAAGKAPYFAAFAVF